MANAASPGPRSLALVMIVRDEARCIERCLQSAARYVDRMVVLDTGSTDNTVSLARACGAEVHQMLWPDSFALARNRALALADAEWSLILDADEWIVSGGETLRDAVQALTGLGTVRVDSQTQDSAVASDWLTRLLPRGVCYEGVVHEQPVSALPRQRIPLVVGHDGYLAEPLTRKQGRNRRLLATALEVAEDDPYLLFQMGKDHETYGELGTAVNYYLLALEQETTRLPFRPQLIIRTLHCLGKTARIPDAMALASEALQELSHSPDFQFTLGDLCLDGALAYPHDASQVWLPLAEAAWLRCLEIGECPHHSGAVTGRGSFLAAHNLHVIYEGLGDADRSTQYRDLRDRLEAEARAAAPAC